jgi:hypothetical protein
MVAEFMPLDSTFKPWSLNHRQRDVIGSEPPFPALPANGTYRQHCQNAANDPTATFSDRLVK